jgi:hypothetical protein
MEQQNELKQTTHRRGFLGKLATGAAALGLASLASPFTSEAQDKKRAPQGDKKAAPIVSASPADAWFEKIGGKHRIVFDATRPNGMMPFAWPKVFILTNGKTGSQASDCGVVVILRHEGIPYAFENRIWEQYNFAEVFKVDDPHDHTGKTMAKTNPFWKPNPKYSIPGVGEVAIGINDLMADGVRFCVCDMAMTVYSAVVAEQMKKPADEVKKDWMSGLLPGVQVVPSGVWAVGRAQEHGCKYCFAG